MGHIIVGIVFIIGGLSGAMTLRGTGSSIGLAVVGVGIVVWGIIQQQGSGEQRERPNSKGVRKAPTRASKRKSKKTKNCSEVEDFIAGSYEGLQLATEAHSKTWHLGDEKKWDVDQTKGNIIFTFKDGVVVTSPIQIIGTFNAKEKTFMWGWDHQSVEVPLQKNAFRVKEYGRDKGIKEFTTQKIPCTEQRAWELTALAMRLAEASGCYRGESTPGVFVYFNFGKVSIEKKTIAGPSSSIKRNIKPKV